MLLMQGEVPEPILPTEVRLLFVVQEHGQDGAGQGRVGRVQLVPQRGLGVVWGWALTMRYIMLEHGIQCFGMQCARWPPRVGPGRASMHTGDESRYTPEHACARLRWYHASRNAGAHIWPAHRERGYPTTGRLS
jgi:hypothetical protein